MNYVRTKSDEAAVDAGCYFDIASADRVRTFFAKYLRHSKGEFAGKPFELLDWQWENVVAPLFGWKMPDGTRRFRRCGIAVPKKNGKSTLLAGIGLYLLVADREPGAEIYTAAADRKQASIIFNEAACMVNACSLKNRLEVRTASKTIRYPQADSVLEALSADVPTKDGFNIHGLLFDELHTQPTPALWNTLRYGGAARRQPMIFWITTAGVDRESLCFDQWQQALAIQESRAVDISFHACIYAASEADDWTKEETWKKANPSYGLTITKRDMEESCLEARNSPANENNFRRYRCLPYFWLPHAALRNRERSNRTRLDTWVRQGFITTTEGDVIDYAVIRRDINRLATLFKIDELAIDPWNATQLATDFQADNLKVEFVRTGYISISAATKEFEKLVLGGSIQHPGNPVLDWMLSNIAVEQDASGNLKPTKAKSAEKIDGVVALILALARHIKTGPKRSSKYGSGGVVGI